MAASFRVAPLDLGRDRSGFACGVEAVDRYFREQVAQDVRRRVTSCFVALDEGDGVAGFYTLAATSALLTDLPRALAKKLPRYPTVPAIRMGRLAVGLPSRGKGLGAALLADALSRSMDSEVAGFALVVDAKDDLAEEFYRHHGFQRLGQAARTLFLPLATALAAKR